MPRELEVQSDNSRTCQQDGHRLRALGGAVSLAGRPWGQHSIDSFDTVDAWSNIRRVNHGTPEASLSSPVLSEIPASEMPLDHGRCCNVPFEGGRIFVAIFGSRCQSGGAGKPTDLPQLS